MQFKKYSLFLIFEIILFFCLFLNHLKEKVTLEEGITITQLAVLNAVGSQSHNYFRNLDRILNQLPCTIMGMTWNQVVEIVVTIRFRIIFRKTINATLILIYNLYKYIFHR